METDEKSNADYWNAQGRTLGKDRRFEEAIVCFDKATQIDPNHAKAWYNKGLCLKNLGLLLESLACFSEAVSLDPDDTDAASKMREVAAILRIEVDASNAGTPASPHNPSISKHDFSTAQLRVIWIAIGLIVLSLVFPPWKVGMGTYGRSYSEGYSLITSPRSGAVGIDLERLVLQAAVVVIVAWGAVVTMAGSRNRRDSRANGCNENTKVSGKTYSAIRKMVNSARTFTTRFLRSWHYGWLCLCALLVCLAIIVVLKYPSPHHAKYDWSGATFLSLLLAGLACFQNASSADKWTPRQRIALVVFAALGVFAFSMVKDQYDKLYSSTDQAARLTQGIPNSPPDPAPSKLTAQAEPTAVLPPVAKHHEPVSLPNGTILLRKNNHKGLGKLTIDNGTDEDAVVKMVRVDTHKKDYCKVYIKSHSQIVVDGVKPGNYELVFELGRDWDKDGRHFRDDRSFSKFDDALTFAETPSLDEFGRGRTEYSIKRVTLNAVPEGTAHTTGMSEHEFDETE